MITPASGGLVSLLDAQISADLALGRPLSAGGTAGHEQQIPDPYCIHIIGDRVGLGR